MIKRREEIIMNLRKMIKIESILLRSAHIIMFVMIVLIIFHLVLYINTSTTLSSELSATTSNYTVMQKNAERFMDASDYLTETVQRFTVIHNVSDMDAYFTEINSTKNRENALNDLSISSTDELAVEQLRKALEYSVDLTDTEIKAIKIICSAKGFEEKYDEIKNAKLPAECEGLTEDEKIHFAQRLVNDQSYYEKKASIRNGMEGCVSTLMDDTRRLQYDLMNKLNTKADYMRIFIIIQTIALFIMFFVTIHISIMRKRRKKAIFSSHNIDLLQSRLMKITDDNANDDPGNEATKEDKKE